MAQSVTSCCTIWSGIYCSFILDEPCAQFLVYHLTCPYHIRERTTEKTFSTEFRLRKFVQPVYFVPFSPMCIYLTSYLHHALFLHCTLFHVTSPLSPTIFTNSSLPHLETIPYPLIRPSESHWVYTLIEPHHFLPILATPLAYISMHPLSDTPLCGGEL